MTDTANLTQNDVTVRVIENPRLTDRSSHPLFRGSSTGSTYSRPSGPIADTCVTYSPAFAQ
jgi:hypothetical protein